MSDLCISTGAGTLITAHGFLVENPEQEDMEYLLTSAFASTEAHQLQSEGAAGWPPPQKQRNI
jgi:hypothetical protein